MFFVTGEMSGEHNRRFGNLGPSTPTNLGVVDPGRIDADTLYEQYRGVKRMRDGRVGFWPDLASREQIRTYYGRPEASVGRKLCLTPWQSLHIMPNGDTLIRSRCFLYKTGNIKENSLAAIWEGERYRVFRRALLTNRYFPVCNRCCGLF
jgi:hypothetical protein